jgi:hypothetical protein
MVGSTFKASISYSAATGGSTVDAPCSSRSKKNDENMQTLTQSFSTATGHEQPILQLPIPFTQALVLLMDSKRYYLQNLQRNTLLGGIASICPKS